MASRRGPTSRYIHTPMYIWYSFLIYCVNKKLVHNNLAESAVISAVYRTARSSPCAQGFCVPHRCVVPHQSAGRVALHQLSQLEFHQCPERAYGRVYLLSLIRLRCRVRVLFQKIYGITAIARVILYQPIPSDRARLLRMRALEHIYFLSPCPRHHI
jgi:hypothetical protein